MADSFVQVGEPLSWGSLSVFPLFAALKHVDYQLLDEGLEGGTLTIEELHEQGSVPDLVVENRANRRVLLLEGEELVGAKQNRVLNTSVLVPARSRLKIPVSCVERGRWRYHSPAFDASGHHSSSHLRRVLAQSVSASLCAEAGCRSDQIGVWHAIAKEQEELGVSSLTQAMSDTYASIDSSIQELREHIPPVESACGMLVSIGPRFVALDLFDSHHTCRKAWTRLLGGYAIDAARTTETATRPDVAQAHQFVSHLADAPWRATETVGEGEEYRAEVTRGDLAIKLCLHGGLVHARLLAGTDSQAG